MTSPDPSPIESSTRPWRFAWFAWTTVAYVGAVILFGAVVRVTGSGAGCGTHWPTCQGEVIHLPKRLETVIELSHRITSGISLLVVLLLFWLVRRDLGPEHPVRRYAGLAILFLVVESLIGAVLVLFGLVVEDRSIARAFMMPLHLANASMLMGTLSLAALGSTRALPRLGGPWTARQWQLLVVSAALLLASMLGALTALGDGLFPPEARSSVWTHIVADQSVQAHWLEQLRVMHPVVSILVSVMTIQIARSTLDDSVSKWGRNIALALIATVTVQLGAGTLNVLLNAPAFMQVLHLALALLAFNLTALLWAEVSATRD